MFFRHADVVAIPEQDSSPEEKMSLTSYGRYYQRLVHFKADGKPFPRSRHHGFWLIHNCLVHPLLSIAAKPFLLDLHELSSRWLNQKPRPYVLDASRAPKIQSYFFWFFHNSVSHILIGVLPLRPLFAFHDWTATLMGVPDWA